MAVRVGFRCDASSAIGAGHVVRCLALAEELARRGVDCVFMSNIDSVPWLRREIAARGIETIAPPNEPNTLAHVARRGQFDAVVLDGYHFDVHTGGALRREGRTVLSVVDGKYGQQEADLYLDQNLDPGLPVSASGPTHALLLGPRFALIRDAVCHLRPDAVRARSAQNVLSVLVVVGGTDPHGMTPLLVDLLLELPLDLEVTAVATREETRLRLHQITSVDNNNVRVVEAGQEVLPIAASSDLVISAAGTTMLELFCLGAPTALVMVADNQRANYTAAVADRTAVGLGHHRELHTAAGRDSAGASLERVLTDISLRHTVGETGWYTVDGLGRQRVADRLLAWIDDHR